MSGRNQTKLVLWSRRRIVVSALALAALATAMPRAGARSAVFSSAVFTWALDAPELWRNRAAARAIGRRYLAEHPDEADAGRLRHHLFGDAGAMPGSPGAMRDAIGAARNRDFAQGDSVLVDGWLLARSEARLCALSALS